MDKAQPDNDNFFFFFFKNLFENQLTIQISLNKML